MDLAEDEKEKEQRTERKVKFEEEPNDGETYTNDELLAWIGKGPGKGGKAGGKKGSKGKFEGNCHYCGTYGHRISDCRKKDADMKGKGKGYELSQGPAWAPPYPSKGKGKGNKGTWGVWVRRRVERGFQRLPVWPSGHATVVHRPR